MYGKSEASMIVNMASPWGTVGPFTEPRSEGGAYFDRVDEYGIGGDYDNSIPSPYLKLLQYYDCIGFPKGREWDGTAEDAFRLYDLGLALLKSELESGNTEVDEVDGVIRVDDEVPGVVTE
jgi:hypothetical protein